MSATGGVPGRSSAGGQRPPERGPHAEHVEEVSRDDRELHLLGLGLPGHVPAPERPRGQAVVAPAFGSKILEVRLRERQLELPLVRLASPEEHEAVRVREGERVEHHAVDDREHRGGRPNPQCQRQHGDQGEAGRAHEPARGVSEVLEHSRTLANRLPGRAGGLSHAAAAS